MPRVRFVSYNPVPFRVLRPRLQFSVLFLFAALAGGRLLRAAEQSPVAVDFLDRYCTSCHNDVDRKGRLDLESVPYDPDDRTNLAFWAKVHDRVQAGEMPPKQKRRPDGQQLEQLIPVSAVWHFYF